jgi:7,8-dihydropterin-6-yl-methyl-4-(beta-D-ribofuranosyl)aminobenzene 5'-phosphate synthase
MIKRILIGLVLFLAFISSGEEVNKSKAVFDVKEGTITNLYDAFGKDKSLTKDFGFSCITKYKGKTILFDSGTNAEIFKNNSDALGIDLTKIDIVIISHAHPDHLNGLDYLLQVNPKVKIYFPFDFFWGAPANIEFVRTSKEILPGLNLIATSSEYMGYFSCYPNKSFVEGEFEEIENECRNINLPELSLSMQTEKGQVLIAGCSHTGIDKILKEMI